MKRRLPLLLSAVALATNMSCDDSAGPSTPPPRISGTAVLANPWNVLSAVVAVEVSDADSIAVRIRALDSEASESYTAAVSVGGDSAAIPVLGLFPESRYRFTPVAFGAGGTAAAPPIEFTTGALPSDLPHYSASGTDPSPGFVLFAANPYAIVIDNSGRVVWYRRFADNIGLNFMAQPNGHYVARPPTPQPGDAEPWIELDVLGNLVRTMSCAFGMQPRLHDLLALPDGSYWILCDDIRVLDLDDLGLSDARVIGTAVQHISASGTPLFQWSPFDHFTIGPDDITDRLGTSINWTHGNALDFDTDGNLLVSFRNLGEVTKIAVGSGAVMWRLGGRYNQFVFEGTAMPAFARQHSARRSGGGGLLLLDNVGDPAESRAERYEVDAAQRSARLTGSYGSAPGVVTEIGGSVQSLPGERTLVSFGTAGRVEEYDAGGRVVWRIDGNAGYVFRAQRIGSLYAPGTQDPR